MIGGEHAHSSDFSDTFNEELKPVDREKKEAEPTRPVGFGTTERDRSKGKERTGWGE